MAVPFNLASTGNSPDRSTKSTRLHLNVLPQLVNTGFQVLFHSPPGVLFTFPSQYSALSVTKEYLALRGGPRSFPQGFSCLVVLWILLCFFPFRLRGSHPLWLAFPYHSAKLLHRYVSPQPQRINPLVWPLPRSLATTCGISVDFSSSPYLDVSVQAVPRVRLFDSTHADRVLLCRVSPFGNLRVKAYVQLTAAYRSLSRPSSAPDAKAFPLRSL